MSVKEHDESCLHSNSLEIRGIISHTSLLMLLIPSLQATYIPLVSLSPVSVGLNLDNTFQWTELK